MGYSCKIYALMVQIKDLRSFAQKMTELEQFFSVRWNFLIFEISPTTQNFMVFRSSFKIPAMGPIFGPET